MAFLLFLKTDCVQTDCVFFFCFCCLLFLFCILCSAEVVYILVFWIYKMQQMSSCTWYCKNSHNFNLSASHLFYLHSRCPTFFSIYLLVDLLAVLLVFEFLCHRIHLFCSHRIKLDFCEVVPFLPECTFQLSAGQLYPIHILQLRAVLHIRCNLSQYVASCILLLSSLRLCMMC